MPKEISKGISIDPEVMAGKPVIRGTHIPVDLILNKLSANHNLDELLSNYPELTVDQVKDCLRYAAIMIRKKKMRRQHLIPW